MKVRILLATLVVAALAGASALAAPAGPTAGKSPIVVGFPVALSGFMTSYDGPSDNFLKLYFDRINAKGGIDGHLIKTVWADTKSDRAQGPKAAQEVLAKGAQLMIVSCDYDWGSPAAFVAIQKGMLAMFTCCESPKCGVQGVGPTAFTMGTGTPVQGAAIAEFAYYKMHWRKAYTLLDDTNEFNRTSCQYFEQRWKELPGTSIVGSDTFLQTDTSVAAQITRFKSTKTKPDFLELCSYMPGAASAMRQIRASGINLPITGNDANDGVYWLGAVPGLSNFFVPTYGFIYGKDPRPAINNTIAIYKQHYGSLPPTSQGLAGWAIGQVLEYALGKTHGDPNGKALTKVIENLKDFPTVIGPATFKPTLHIDLNRVETINEVVNGKWHFVTLLRPRKVPQPKF